MVGALALSAAPALVMATAAGIVADELLGTAPMLLGLCVGLGALWAAAGVARTTLAAYERLAPRARNEEATE